MRILNAPPLEIQEKTEEIYALVKSGPADKMSAGFFV